MNNFTISSNSNKKNPKQNKAYRNEFLSKFDWKNSVLTSDEISELENLLIEFEDIFAKHRFVVGYNTEMKIKLTPEHSNAVYIQSPPTPIHLPDEMMVELALLQYYGIITTLTNLKYSSPIFAQRKPSGKLRMLHDLRRINHLLRHDYANHNFPISNMTDAVNHFAGKEIVHKIRLFASVPLRSNGRPALGTIACIPFRIQDIRIQSFGTRFE